MGFQGAYSSSMPLYGIEAAKTTIGPSGSTQVKTEGILGEIQYEVSKMMQGLGIALMV